MHNAIIIGASTGLGRALAERLSARKFNLILVSSDEKELEINSKNCEIRFGNRCIPYKLDLNTMSDSDCNFFLQKCFQEFSVIPYFFVTAGLNSEMDDKNIPLGILDQIVKVNYLSIVRLINRYVQIVEKYSNREIHIVISSSIAASLPRSRNNVYTSSKIALESYCKGLQHSFASQKIYIQIYRFGYIDSQKSYGQKLIFPVSNPFVLSENIIDNLRKKNKKLFYLPAYWELIVRILEFLPWSIYKRLKF